MEPVDVHPDTPHRAGATDVAAYAIVASRYLGGQLPVFRLQGDLLIFPLPSPRSGSGAGGVHWDSCSLLSVRLHYVGGDGRPSLTWCCSCTDHQAFRDHCARGSIEWHRHYGAVASCVHEELVYRVFGSEMEVVHYAAAAPTLDISQMRRQQAWLTLTV